MGAFCDVHITKLTNCETVIYRRKLCRGQGVRDRALNGLLTSEINPDAWRLANGTSLLDSTAVPEPTTLGLISMGIGLAGLAIFRRARAVSETKLIYILCFCGCCGRLSSPQNVIYDTSSEVLVKFSIND